MDKETLSNYGWIVICVLVLAVMIALAGPFGTFVAGAVKSTTAGLFGVNQNALGAAGIEIGDQAFADCEHLETEIRNATADYSGDTCCKECGTVLSTGTYVIPTGGTYTKADGTVLNAGQQFPETATTGDIYLYGDYEYRYNTKGYYTTWTADESLNGWGVKVNQYKRSKTSYDPCLSQINGQAIVNMDYTYKDITTLNDVSTLIIPDTVTSARYLFYQCSGIVDASVLTIPGNVKDLYMAFCSCNKMTSLPVLSEGIESLQATFIHCTGLTNLSDYVIPSSVTNMSNTFYYCSNLVTVPVIPNNVTKIDQLFCGCTSITDTIEIYATISNSMDCMSIFASTGQPISVIATSDVLINALKSYSNITIVTK